MSAITLPNPRRTTDECDSWVAQLQSPTGEEQTQDLAARRAAMTAERQPAPKHDYDNDVLYPTFPALAQL